MLPESKLSKSNEGNVVSVGPGGKTSAGETLPMSVSIGDTVLLPEYGGLPVKIDGEEGFIFRESELLAKYT